MSRTLSKIMLACALIIVIPLLIVGTAFAAYYSIDATVSVELYVNEVVEGGYARVDYKKQSINTPNKPLEITDGHKKTINLKAVGVGYVFEGWYAGTYKEYVQERKDVEDGVKEKVNLVTDSNATNLKVGMTDYQNLVAVFNAKYIDVAENEIATKGKLTFNYEIEPAYDGSEGIYVTTAPKGKMSYKFGEKLEVLDELTERKKFTFSGWYKNSDFTGAKVTTANFTDAELAEGVVLYGHWVDSVHVTVKYLDHEGTEISQTNSNVPLKTDFYADHEYELVDPSECVPTDSSIASGYTYVWQVVETGQNLVDNKIKPSTNLTLKISPNAINYTAKLEVAGDDLTISSSVPKTVPFTVEKLTAVDEWNKASNWTAKYSFWEFNGLAYSYVDDKGTDVTDDDEIITGTVGVGASLNTVLQDFIDKNPSATATLNITVQNVKKNISGLTGTISYKCDDGDSYAGTVYNSTGTAVSDASWAEDEENIVDLTIGLIFQLENNYYSDAAHTNRVSAKELYYTVKYNGSDDYVSARIALNAESSNKTVKDLIELIFEDVEGNTLKVENGILSIDVVVRFK